MTDRFPKVLAALGLATGTAAALFYYRQGLALSHYDAKAHLVVARRILDSLTPEYSQIGAVWLPLPHLLNLLPVQIDAFYRTGASGVAISVLSFAVACYAVAHLVQRVTGSSVAAVLSVIMVATDPDVLYLQSTPMTEPLLFGLTLLAISFVYDWVEAHDRAEALSHWNGAPTVAQGFSPARQSVSTVAQGFSPVLQRESRARARAGWTLVAACLTRYEAWFVTAAVLALAAVALWRSGRSLPGALKSTTQLAVYPVLAIVGFFFHSWFTTGAWFVTGGFFVPDNVATANPFKAIMAVVYGMRILAGTPLVLVALAGGIVLLWYGLSRQERAASLVVLALAGFMVLPAYAFYEGHPFRMRYMVAPTVGVYVLAGVAIGMLSGLRRGAVAIAVAAWLAATVRPLDPQAPMVLEAQWDVPFSRERRNVTACFTRDYRGERILASMGSLAHYMQELSHAGINIRDFVHEGNLPYWQEAVALPYDHVGWILVEERAEGGDVLAARTRESSVFLTGFRRVCAGGGVVLYKAEGSSR
ncbi:MAG TPA: hypothetical protein VJM31_15510 [Vicinamibacterales bacterium]|nr:hypothetical protein [Vicinamibacterales bacterium]